MPRPSSYWLLDLGALFIIASACACGPTGGRPGDGGDDVPRDGGDPSSLARCFEIFPSLQNAPGSMGDGGTGNQNPMRFEFGAVAVGATSEGGLRYYNFCNDPAPTVLGVDFTGPDGAAVDPSFALTTNIPERFNFITMSGSQLVVRFAPRAPGRYSAVLRLRMNHGYYETRFEGEGVAR